MQIIDITKIIELKKVLNDKFNAQIHIHDTCGGQYFSVENLEPSAKDFIKNYFQEKSYRVIFDKENEFHLERVQLC